MSPLLNYIPSCTGWPGIREIFAAITSTNMVRTLHLVLWVTLNLDRLINRLHTTLSFLVNGRRTSGVQHGEVCSAYWETFDHCCIPRLRNGPHAAWYRIAWVTIVYCSIVLLLELRRFVWQIKETQGLLLELSWMEMIYCYNYTDYIASISKATWYLPILELHFLQEGRYKVP